MLLSTDGFNQWGASLFIFTEKSFKLDNNSFVIIEYTSNQTEYVEIRLIEKSSVENEENEIKDKIFEKVKEEEVPSDPPKELKTGSYTPVPVITAYTMYNDTDTYLSQQIDMRDLTKSDEYYIVLGFHLDFRKKKLFRIKVYSQAEAAEVAE